MRVPRFFTCLEDYMTVKRVYGPYSILGLESDAVYGLQFHGSFGL